VTLVLGESEMASVADLWPDSPCYQDHGTQLPACDECDSVTSMVGSSTDRGRPAQRFVTGVQPFERSGPDLPARRPYSPVPPRQETNLIEKYEPAYEQQQRGDHDACQAPAPHRRRGGFGTILQLGDPAFVHED
jgi:hypothetical protein